MSRSRFFMSLLAVSTLFGCNTADPNLLAVTCPTVAVLAQASEVSRFAPTGREFEDTVLRAEMRPAALSCEYEAGDPEATVDLRIPIIVRQGPAPGGAQTLTYFVAVVDPAGNVVSKREFQRVVDANAGEIAETVRGTVIRLGPNLRPYQFQILTGFQLAPDELARGQAPRPVP